MKASTAHGPVPSFSGAAVAPPLSRKLECGYERRFALLLATDYCGSL
jgi:hypothetical protein